MIRWASTMTTTTTLALLIWTTTATVAAMEEDVATARMRTAAADLKRSLGVDLDKDQVHKIMANVSSAELSRAYRLYEESVKAMAVVSALHEEFDSVSVDEADQHSVHATATAFDVSRSRGMWLHSRPKRSSASASSPITLNVSLDNKLPSSASSDLAILITRATLTVGVRGRGRGGEGVTVVLRQLMSADDDAGVAIDSVKASDSEDTVSLDASAAVQQWVIGPESNHGLVVECVGCLEDDSGNVDVELVMSNGGADIEIEAKSLHRPSWFRAKRSLLLSKGVPLPSRNRVDCRPAAPSASSAEASESTADPDVWQRRMDRRSWRPQRCCRETLPVKLSALGGFEFVLEPASFDAHMCRGRCPTRFNPASPHALLQSLMHAQTKGKEKDGDRVPRPCCAPSRLLPIPVLHISRESAHKLDVAHWKDMVVADCKCT